MSRKGRSGMQAKPDVSTQTSPRLPPRPSKRQHFNIVVAGEFNSGKSSVINLLLRQPALPPSVGFSEMPPIRIFPADRTAYTLVGEDSGLIEPSEFLAGAVKGKAVRSAVVELPLPEFRGASITEVGIGLDGKLHPEMKAALLSADLLIWCTMAQRAWCLTEITVVEGLPPELLEGAVLAVTRADYLKGEGQRELVRGRLAREAGKFFDGIVLLDASPAAIGGGLDAQAWSRSGGETLFGQVMAKFSASSHYGQEPAVAELESLENFRAPPAEAPAAEPSPPRPDRAEVLRLWHREVDAIAGWMEEGAEIDPGERASAARARVRRFAADNLATPDPEDVSLAPLGRLFEVRLAQLEGLGVGVDPATGLMLTVELLCQIEEDMAYSGHT